MPFALIRSLALIKKCAALANQKFGLISDQKAGAIVQSAEEIMEKKVGRAFSASGMADREWNGEQYECQ